MATLKLTGKQWPSRAAAASSSSTPGLASVVTDGVTLSGNGTSQNPLKVAHAPLLIEGFSLEVTADPPVDMGGTQPFDLIGVPFTQGDTVDGGVTAEWQGGAGLRTFYPGFYADGLPRVPFYNPDPGVYYGFANHADTGIPIIQGQQVPVENQPARQRIPIVGTHTAVGVSVPISKFTSLYVVTRYTLRLYDVNDDLIVERLDFSPYDVPDGMTSDNTNRNDANTGSFLMAAFPETVLSGHVTLELTITHMGLLERDANNGKYYDRNSYPLAQVAPAGLPSTDIMTRTGVRDTYDTKGQGVQHELQLLSPWFSSPRRAVEPIGLDDQGDRVEVTGYGIVFPNVPSYSGSVVRSLIVQFSAELSQLDAQGLALGLVVTTLERMQAGDLYANGANAVTTAEVGATLPVILPGQMFRALPKTRFDVRPTMNFRLEARVSSQGILNTVLFDDDTGIALAGAPLDAYGYTIQRWSNGRSLRFFLGPANTAGARRHGSLAGPEQLPITIKRWIEYR